MHDHSSFKIKRVSARSGPSPIQEKNELVDWIIKIIKIGYGISSDKRPDNSKFHDNYF